MLNTGNSNGFLTLYQVAQDYLRLGYSVIPVHTSAARAKAAAVAWSTYQQRRPTPDELRTWFVEQGHTGLAVVTGIVSGLAVLDLDDSALFGQFQCQHPDLAVTRTVCTRRGFHLWFAIPDKHPVASRKGQGMDWKADSGYVVAPPTCIGGHTYTVLDDGELLTLTRADIAAVQAFLNGTTHPKPRNRPRVEAVAPSHSLVDLYRRHAIAGSRNEALFQASCRARDSGYAVQTTIDLLAEAHIRQPAVGNHRPEHPRQRYREAVTTITSAYSRPPRPQVEQGRAQVEQLPNSVREKLFQMGCTHTIRVIEALRLHGVQPGQVLTYAQIVDDLAGQVGQWSIRAALAATTPNGVPLLERIPPPPPTTNAHADKHKTKDMTILANGGDEKPSRSLAHRPATHYILPSNDDLCRKLDVLTSPSDPLAADDLTSAKQTRMAAHRELIKRRPGLYPRRWLARRLGVDAETLDTYNREIPIDVRHCFSEKPISWHNLDDIPLALDLAGAFLEDETGKRYPAKREIARKLLARGHTISYKRQDVNFYCYGEIPHRDPATALPLSPASPPSVMPKHPFLRPALWSNATGAFTIVPLTTQPGTVHLPAEAMATAIAQTTHHDRLAENRLAERVYRTVARLSHDKAQRMSKANAHRLVETYGAAAVEQALKKLKWYASKGRVTKPAGFLITTSRLAWRELHGKTEAGSPAPRFRGDRRLPDG